MVAMKAAESELGVHFFCCQHVVDDYTCSTEWLTAVDPVKSKEM